MAFLCAKIMVHIQCFLNPCHTWMSVCPFNGTYKMFFFPFEQNHKISREQFAVHTKTDVGEQGIKLKLRRVESRDWPFDQSGHSKIQTDEFAAF